jgi:hypothetical protein
MRGFVQTLGRRGPIVMSCLAILLLVIALTTGWERGYKDEGVVAHTWQLLIGLQVPLILAFIATADWKHPVGVAKVLGIQAALLVAAMAPVAILHL